MPASISYLVGWPCCWWCCWCLATPNCHCSSHDIWTPGHHVRYVMTAFILSTCFECGYAIAEEAMMVDAQVCVVGIGVSCRLLSPGILTHSTVHMKYVNVLPYCTCITRYPTLASQQDNSIQTVPVHGCKTFTDTYGILVQGTPVAVRSDNNQLQWGKQLRYHVPTPKTAIPWMCFLYTCQIEIYVRFTCILYAN